MNTAEVLDLAESAHQRKVEMTRRNMEKLRKELSIPNGFVGWFKELPQEVSSVLRRVAKINPFVPIEDLALTKKDWSRLEVVAGRFYAHMEKLKEATK